MYKIFLILRYLSKKTLILISMGGVTVAVTVFIVVFSVLDGFGQNIERRLRGTISDVVVEDVSGDGLTDYEAIIREIQKENPHIAACAPYVERIAMFQEYMTNKVAEDGNLGDLSRQRGHVEYGMVRGIDPARELLVGRLSEFLRDGGYYESHPDTPITQALRPGSMAVIVGARAPGERFAESSAAYTFISLPDGKHITPKGSSLEEQIDYMNKYYGERNYFVIEGGLIVYSTVTGHIERTNYNRFHVAGMFKTWGYEYDSSMVYMNLEDAQRLLKMGKPYIDPKTGKMARSAVTGISVKLDSYDNLADVKKTIEAVLAKHGANCTVRGWTDARRSMLDAIAVEKAVAVTILTCIVLVMGFGIFSILSISSGQKARDIGILKSIGATDGGILAIFLSTGLAIGIVGSIAGTALGILVASNVNEIQAFIARLTGWELFPKDVFYFDKIPSQIHPGVYLAIAATTLAVCLIASIVPALMAARRDPTRTLVV
jgi:lipoprotein-releasing system permease protein